MRLVGAPLSDHRIQLFTVTDTPNIGTCWMTNLKSAWSPWMDMAGPTAATVTRVMAGPLSDGRLQLWARDDAMRLWTCWKVDTRADAGWSPWSEFINPMGSERFAGAPRDDGRLQLWALDMQRALWTCWKASADSSSHWSRWVEFQVAEAVGFTWLAAGPLPDGRLQLWGLDVDGWPWSCWQTGSDPPTQWSPWTPFPRPPDRSATIAVGSLSDGRPQLWVQTRIGLFSCWKVSTEPSDDWSAWTAFPNPPNDASLAVARLPDGRLQVWASDADPKKLWACWKLDPDSNSGWSGWADFPPPTPSAQATAGRVGK